jgi:hypothetical protein
MEYDWIITYRIVGDTRVLTMEISLHFNKAHNVGKWFKMCYNGTNGKRNCEFINAKIKEDGKEKDGIQNEEKPKKD